MANLIGVVQSGYFLWGIALGGLGLMTALTVARLSKGGRPLGAGGIVLAFATLAALSIAGGSSAPMWVGLALILVAAEVPPRLGLSESVAALAVVPGAIVVALAAPPDPDWVRPLVVVATPLLGYLSVDFESRYGDRGFGVVFFGLAAMGSFLAVPDTEWVRTLFAVCVVMALGAWPKTSLSLGRSGSYMAVSVFVLFSSVGGIGRPASVLAAVACLGYLVLEPLAVILRPRLGKLPWMLNRTPEAALLAAVPQFAMVLLLSRVAARYHSAAVTVGIVAIVAGLAYSLLVWVEHTRLIDPAEAPSDV